MEQKTGLPPDDDIVSRSLVRPSADDLLPLPLGAMSVFFDGDDGRVRACTWYNRREL